jgi:succinoglycan biosynthesis transport protein ExoP
MSGHQGQAADLEPVFEESAVALSDVPSSTAAFLFGGGHVGEGLRAAGTRIRLGDKEKRIRSLAVVSSIEADGKTSVALGLAAACARAGQRVLLIDADLRQREICARLGIRPWPGLAEWLESRQDKLPVRQVGLAGFYLLAAGIAPCRPELLGSPRLSRLLSAAENHFDLVILDCAPLLPVADSLALRDLVNGFLMVVRARHTPREAVSRGAALLGPKKIVGVIMNAYRSRLPMRRGYHYGHGSSYRYGPSYGSLQTSPTDGLHFAGTPPA